MELHRFRVGQTVRFVKVALNGAFGGTPPGNFQIVGLLPDTHGRNQYRVQSTSDRHQRVAAEDEIASQ